MTEINIQVKDELLSQGAALIMNELKTQANQLVSLQDSIELRNVDLLSTNLIVNKDVYTTIKNEVKERSNNIKKIIKTGKPPALPG